MEAGSLHRPNRDTTKRAVIKQLPTLLVLSGAIAIVQWHSIAFWSAQINPAIGWLWSVALEAAALWLWYRPGKVYALLGAGASLLLLAGPMHQIAAPILDAGLADAHADAARGALIRQQEEAVLSAETQLNAVLGNSQSVPRWSRNQWIAPISAAQSRTDAARATLGRLVAQPPRFGAEGESRRRAIIGMQAAALCVLQITGILCITSLRRPPAPIIVYPAGPSPATDALLPEPKRIKYRAMKRPALGRGLDGLLDYGEGRRP